MRRAQLPTRPPPARRARRENVGLPSAEIAAAAASHSESMSEFTIPSEFDFGQHFDRVTLSRAMILEPERAVISLRTEGPMLITLLRGSTGTAYEQRIELPIDRRLGLRVRGSCSCPVGANCKHVAAALMAFEALQIRQRKSGAPPGPLSIGPAVGNAAALGSTVLLPPAAPVAPLPPRSASTLAAAPRADAPDAGELPRALIGWLTELPDPGVSPADPSNPAAPKKRLMYVLSALGTQLRLGLAMGSLRKTGDIGSHRAHSPSLIDMLRTQPGYLEEIDVPALAALLPLPALSHAGHTLMRGRQALTALHAMLATGRVWLRPSPHIDLPEPPGEPARWDDEPAGVRLQWRSDAAGQWRVQWQSVDGQPATVVLLPQPLLVDLATSVIRPAQVEGTAVDSAVAEWLDRMPAVPNELLARFTERLQAGAGARGVAVPLPDAQARELRDLGAPPLVPVLRLTSCIDVVSESLLHHRYGLANARHTVRRQPAAHLLLRYRPDGHEPVDFAFPAGAADTAYLEVDDPVRAGAPRLARLQRDAAGEARALVRLFDELDFRPWSLAAGVALDRLPSLTEGRRQSSALPQQVEGQPILLVLRQPEQWPAFVSRRVDTLRAAGWEVEQADDFPIELHDADGWDLQVDDDGDAAHPWFSVGLSVQVDGRPVDLVPLLVGLVRSGWLSLNQALREHGEAARDPNRDPNRDPDRDPHGDPANGAADDLPREVLVPWPDDIVVAGHAPRQRLLRLPVERIAPLLDWLRAVFDAGGRDTPLRLSRFDLGTLDALSAGATLRAPPRYTELLEQVRALRGGEGLPAVPPSPHVNATLRPYQRDGLAWMDFLRRAGFGGVLADDMGLGKTLQALAMLQGELDAGRLDRPSLVVVPTSLVGNWRAEAERFTPGLRVLVLHGPQRASLHPRIPQAHLVVISYPLALRDMEVLSAQNWHCVLLDEAQRIKNSRSQAALSLKGLRARHRLCLSGTPLENHLGELWSLMDFVCPGLLGGEAQFREQYRLPIERRQDTLAAEQLARRVRPFILRRTKQQVARDLPEKTETLLRVEIGGAQADLYETVRATMDSKLREAIAQQGLARSRIMVLDALLKLRQVCCDPRLLKAGGATPGGGAGVAASAKLELLLELLPTLIEDGRRVLLFSQFTEMLALIETELGPLELPYLKLTGDTPDRAAVVERFQSGEVPLFLVSLKAGGVGLNLTAADTVILYDPWWNPAVEQQAIDRAYRIGQDKPVFVYKLVASGTVEDKMLELQARKADLADALLSGVASDAALDADDFDELFKPLGGLAGGDGDDGDEA